MEPSPPPEEGETIWGTSYPKDPRVGCWVGHPLKYPHVGMLGGNGDTVGPVCGDVQG